MWADGVYNGKVIDRREAETGLDVEMVKRSYDMNGFVALPKRWRVQRPFAWLGKYHLLSKEYERTVELNKSDIFLAMTSLMLRRLTTPADERKEARNY